MSTPSKPWHRNYNPELDAINAVEMVSRRVIEKKLLTALGEGNTVAVLFTAPDLDVVAKALELYGGSKAKELAAGFRQLQREAFPPNPS